MFEVETADFDYATRDGVPLRARIYQPRGEGPFPAFVDLHGGAWIKGSYVNNDPINMPVAQGGVVILAIDYRVPPAGTYPSSVADVNYAVRWLKKNAERYRSRSDMVGLMGTSAGGHLAVLAGMKPFDPRYAAIPLEGGESLDASVSQIVAMWPVICPATRFYENSERQARGDNSLAHLEGSLFNQMAYWINVDQMADGSPTMALERGDKLELPDLLYVQAHSDKLHTRKNVDRFCNGYRHAGGHLEMEWLEEEAFDSLRAEPEAASSKRAVRHIIDFAHGERFQVEAATSG